MDPSPAYGITRDGGFFYGKRPDGFFIAIETNTKEFFSSEITVKSGKRAHGFMDPANPNINYLASDIAKEAPFEYLRAGWTHEVANSIAAILTKLTGTDMRVHAKNPALRSLDDDSGTAMEECIYGGKVFYDSRGVGVTTNPGR